MSALYSDIEPPRTEVDELQGPVVIEFGAPWCGYCRAAQPLIDAAFAEHAGVRHLKIEDAPGRKLGRSFRVKLWPTLVFLSNGKEVARVVRPIATEPLSQALAQIDVP